MQGGRIKKTRAVTRMGKIQEEEAEEKKSNVHAYEMRDAGLLAEIILLFCVRRPLYVHVYVCVRMHKLNVTHEHIYIYI